MLTSSLRNLLLVAFTAAALPLPAIAQEAQQEIAQDKPAATEATQTEAAKIEELEAQKALTQHTYLSRVYLDLSRSVAAESHLGLELDAASAALRSQLDLPEDQGLVVTAVVPDSAADAAGVKPNDVLLTLSDIPVKAVDSFREKLATLSQSWKTEGGDKRAAALRLLRAGKRLTVELAPKGSDSNDLIVTARLALANSDAQKYWIGVAVSDVDATLRAQLSLPENQGVVITEVYPNQAGEKAGLKVHDVLLELHGKPLTTSETLRTLVQELGAAGDTATIKLLRGGKPATLSITPLEKQFQLGYLNPRDAQWIQANADQQLATDVLVRSLLTNSGQLSRNTLAITPPASAYQIWGAGANPAAPLATVTATVQPNTADATALQLRELLDAIQKLSQKVESLEQTVKSTTKSEAK